MISLTYLSFIPFIIFTWIIFDIIYQRFTQHWVSYAKVKYHVYALLGVLLALGWFLEARALERASERLEECSVEVTRLHINELHRHAVDIYRSFNRTRIP